MGRRRKEKTIEPGDLVTHILMDDTWMGLVIRLESFILEEESITKALIYLVSPHSFSKWHGGSESTIKTYENHTMKVGWVDVDFLHLISKGAINKA